MPFSKITDSDLIECLRAAYNREVDVYNELKSLGRQDEHIHDPEQQIEFGHRIPGLGWLFMHRATGITYLVRKLGWLPTEYLPDDPNLHQQVEYTNRPPKRTRG